MTIVILLQINIICSRRYCDLTSVTSNEYSTTLRIYSLVLLFIFLNSPIKENLLVWCRRTIMPEKLCNICAWCGFRWMSHVTFSLCISKFACTDKFVLKTFSINCAIKDLGWCQSMRMHNNLHLKMIEAVPGLPLPRPPPLNKYSLLQMHIANELKSISLIQKMNILNSRRKS